MKKYLYYGFLFLLLCFPCSAFSMLHSCGLEFLYGANRGSGPNSLDIDLGEGPLQDIINRHPSLYEGPHRVVIGRHYALHNFFNRFLLAERTVNGLVALAEIRELDPQDTDALYLLLLERFSLFGVRAEQPLQRIYTLLQEQGTTPFQAFVQVLYEVNGLGLLESKARAQCLLTEATLHHDMERAFWIDIFMNYNLSATQAERAFLNMQERLMSGQHYWYAFWRAILTQFHFSEDLILSLNAMQEGFLLQGMNPHEAFVKALFFSVQKNCGVGFESEVCNSFWSHVRLGENLIEAYYREQFLMAELSAEHAERAVAGLTFLFEADDHVCVDCRNNAYFLVLYNAYGFPAPLACAMARLLRAEHERAVFVQDPFHLFWSVAFRVMGLSGDRIDTAFAWLINFRNRGASFQSAFEMAYIATLTANAVDVHNAFLNLDATPEGNCPRLQNLLIVLWEDLYPGVPKDRIEGAIQGFFQSPSALMEILRSLKSYKK